MKTRYILFILIVLIASPFIYRPAKDAFLFISKPFLFVFEKSGSLLISSPLNFLETIWDVRNLASKNEQLTKEVARLESEKAELVETKRENELLKKQLGFAQENKQLKLIPASIIGRAPDLQYLILNQGSMDGVKLDQVVISEGLLVGKIVEVNFSTSKVFLVTNPTSAVPALTQESRAAGLVRGELGYGLLIEDLPKDINLQKGENVITSGLGGDYPKGLLIGKIEEVVSSPADIFQKASLKPLLDFSKLEMVFVINK